MATFFSVLAELISAIGMLGVGLGVLFFGVAMYQCVDEFEREMRELVVQYYGGKTEE